MTEIKNERERLMDKSMGLYAASTVTSERERESMGIYQRNTWGRVRKTERETEIDRTTVSELLAW